jgi:nicotinate phosphoribosyltransferase
MAMTRSPLPCGSSVVCAVVETTSLATDRYELTMVEAALRSGIAHRRATFEVFTRHLPEGRPYGVVCGIPRVIDAISRFRFSEGDLAGLEQLSPNPFVLTHEFREWLRAYRFSGDIIGYPEGELFTAFSPIVTITGTFAEAVVLETVILSILNHDCAVAAAASLMVTAAQGRRLIEMGTRRTDPNAAVAAARAAYIAGFAATSNLAAGRTYGIPTAGTAAHAFVMAHSTEADAFRAQVNSQGIGTTLLVDTYDIENGIRVALAVASEFGVAGPGAIRIDSGDLEVESIRARTMLDAAGARTTQIVVSGDLDSRKIDALVAANCPIDVFGVGTSVVTGDGHPTASLAYKLVAIEDASGQPHNVAKQSIGKSSPGGCKVAYRVAGHMELVVLDAVENLNRVSGRALQVPLMCNGVDATEETCAADDARIRLAQALDELAGRPLQSGRFSRD